jgi:hypothetical protein
MRTFILERTKDVTGISGTGRVAEGIEYSDGTVALRWIVGEHKSTVLWSSIDDVREIHGHGGATSIVWMSRDRPARRPVTDDAAMVYVLAPSKVLAQAVALERDLTRWAPITADTADSLRGLTIAPNQLHIVDGWASGRSGAAIERMLLDLAICMATNPDRQNVADVLREAKSRA